MKRHVNLESMWVELKSECPALSLSLSCENDMRWLLAISVYLLHSRRAENVNYRSQDVTAFILSIR